MKHETAMLLDKADVLETIGQAEEFVAARAFLESP